MRKVTDQDIKRIKRRYRTTAAEVEEVEEEVATFEDENKIEMRWSVESVEYLKAAEDVAVQQFCDALTMLESLVVQHLLELTKMRQSGLCESPLSITDAFNM
jgi:hypothetical protein